MLDSKNSEMFLYQKDKPRAACEEQGVTCTVLFLYQKGKTRTACEEQRVT